MIIRRIVGILGLVILLVGLMEIALPVFSVSLTRSLAHPLALRVTGAVGLVIGVILLIAWAKRLVGLRLFMLILGIYVVVAGLVTLSGPELVRDLIYALLLRRGPGFQLMILWISGTVRIALGCAVMYAALRPPQPTVGGVS